MKKLTTSVLLVVLSSSFVMVNAQNTQDTQGDTLRTQSIREVVVTGALGLKKRQDAVVTSNKVIGDKELTQAASQNIPQALIGKVSGLQINTTSSGVNPTSKILLRGFRSISGNTDPLFVIDGVVSTSAVFNQLPPDIVENVNVIKGQQGSALYGSQGSNGVIVVTTKRGTRSERVSVNLSSSIEFTSPYKLPIRQNLYGQGYPGEADFSTVDYNGTNWVPYENTSWGPAYTSALGGQLVEVGLPQANGQFLKATYADRGRDNIKDFFGTGIQFKNGFNVSAGGRDSYAFLSYDRLQNEFIVPGDDLKRNTIFFKAGKKIGKFRADGNVSIIDQSINQSNANIYSQLLQTPSNVDIRMFKNSGFAGNYTSFAYNPYALKDYLRGDSRLTSANGIITLGYEFNNHISLSYNGSLYAAGQDVENHVDGYNSNEVIINAPGTGIDGISLRNLGVAAITSSYNKSVSRVRNFYGDLILTFKYDLTDKINFSANVGNNIQDRFSSTTSAGGTNLRIPYLYNIANVVNPTPAYNLNNNYVRSRLYAFFANVDLGLEDYLFVNLTGRIEQSSVLSVRPTGTSSEFSNKAIPYYSAGVSFIPTKAFAGLKDNSFLSYAKLSASYTLTGNPVIGAYDTDEIGVFPTGYPLTNSSFILNKNPTDQFIKPEANKTIEGNVSLGFFKDRITLDASAFQTDTNRLITASTVSSATGLNSLTSNIGNIRNSGFEVDLGLTPFKSTNFEWNLRGSYSKYESLVRDLGPGINEVALAQDGSGIPAGIFAVKGERFPVIKGIKYERDPSGNIIVDETGLPVTDSRYQILGKVTPDYILGFSTNVRFKEFSLAVTADYRTGNSFIADTKSLLGFAGALEETVAFDRAQGYVIPGSVQNTGTAANPIYTPNTTTVGDSPSYNGAANYFTGSWRTTTGEEFVVDGTALKIREIALSYSIPRSVLANSFVRTLTLGVYARNAFAWYAKSNRNFSDPETSSVTVGGIAATSQYPTTRTFGFSLNASF
ncbi:SusC/RagA family TonB-linked outer membrane protein [uncultured Chryseobacterium sp.]|uniref:SusC/RagA family TonB-linked outer membrane protein n=1 Tax=uncultured Chryseobacterium sp. TaxID=259322 RepID=UPI0025E8B475|nr:SusC/RagA family TonB-linked outer membrane protein [uncultured Chryseobacterium sp.]